MPLAALVADPVDAAVATLTWRHIETCAVQQPLLVDLGRFDALHAQAPASWRVLHSEQFSADWQALPFRDQSIPIVILRQVLERLDGRCLIPFLHEVARVTQTAVFLPLGHAPATGSRRVYSVVQTDGRFETYVSMPFLRAVFHDVGFALPPAYCYPFSVMPGAMVGAVRVATPNADTALSNL